MISKPIANWGHCQEKAADEKRQPWRLKAVHSKKKKINRTCRPLRCLHMSD